MFPYILEKEDFFIINLKVIPNAKKTEIIGLLDEALKIKVSSPPVEGKANAQIIKFFSDYLKVSKSKLEIISGEKSKYKQLKVKEQFSKLEEYFNYNWYLSIMN